MSGHSIQLTKKAQAFSIWSLIMPLAGAFMTQAMNPEKHDVFMATAPSLELETPDGNYLPPILSLRQQAVILRKGVRITRIKVGSNGNPLQKVEWYIDGDRRTMIKIEKPPFNVGTKTGQLIFDTADPFWEPGSIHFIGFRAKSDRDEDVDGEHPGFNTIPVVVLDDQPFQRAVCDPNYRQYLTESMGSLPAIPVSRHVDASGNVGFSVGDGKGEAALPGQDMSQAQLSQPGIVQPNQPVRAQRNEGLAIHAFVKGQEANGELRLTRSDQIDFRVGNLASQNVLVIVGAKGKEEYRKVSPGATRQPLAFSRSQPGTYIVQLQAQGPDGSVGDALQLKVVIRK